MDAVCIPGVEEVVGLKGAQVCWSEICRNLMGYWVDMRPGPCLLVGPDENSANAYRDERLAPLMKHTPAVARHVSPKSWDSKKTRIKFDTMSVFIAWAGSKSGLKSRPIQYLVLEEPDEYPPFSSTGGDPISKAKKRLTTYLDKGLARVLLGGTPTTRLGNVWKAWESCTVRFHFWVPCPHCNGYQQLAWKQVKWPKLEEITDRLKKAEKIRLDNLAYYECEHCKRPILDHHKPRALTRGVWASEDQVVTADGRIVGPPARAKRVGFHIPSYYSPWVTFSQLASEWLEAQDDPQALCDFINQRLAEPFEEQRAKIAPTLLEERAKTAPEALKIPAWAQTVIATADTQGQDEQTGYFWYVIRAWGYDYRSQLIDYGACQSKQRLIELTLERQIEWERGGTIGCQALFPDCGGPRWQEIYQLAQADNRIHPMKGLATGRQWMVTESPQKKHNVLLWLVDTEQSKDLLYRLINDPSESPVKWQVHRKIGPDYCSQMASEAKIYDPNAGKELWVEVVRKNNHLWDCEAMQCAAAWRLGCGVPAPKEEPVPAPQQVVGRVSGAEWIPHPPKWT